MIHPALGNFGALELFWEYVLSFKCGCAHTCFVHGLLICTFYVGLENSCFSTKKMKRIKKKKERVWVWALCENWIWKCWSLELLSCLILTYFPFTPIFPLVLFSHLCICSTPCPQPHYNLEKSFWSWFACVLVWLLALETSQVCLIFVFQWCFESKQRYKHLRIGTYGNL